MLINHRQRVRTKIAVDPVTSCKSSVTASTSAPTVLPAMTADRRAATLRANKCVICVFHISQIFIISSNDLSESLKKVFLFFYQINLPVAVCVIKLICLPKG